MVFCVFQDGMRDEMAVECDLQEAFMQSLQSTFVGRKKQLSGALQKLKEAQDVVLVHGKPGTGKSAFMVTSSKPTKRHTNRIAQIVVQN